jgi:hypothetical protein
MLILHHAHARQMQTQGIRTLKATDPAFGVTAFQICLIDLEAGACLPLCEHFGQLAVVVLAGQGRLLLSSGPQRFAAPCSLFIPPRAPYEIANCAITTLQMVMVGTNGAWPVTPAPLAPSGDAPGSTGGNTAKHAESLPLHPPIGMTLLEPSTMITTLETPTRAKAEATALTAAASPPRFDLYATVHKGLRLFMADTLSRVGRLDLDDEVEVAATLGQLAGLLETCRAHLGHENQFVHPTIEARQPGASLRIEGEHQEHLSAMAGLAGDAAALRALPTAAAGHRLYRHLAGFVAENLQHMDIEETAHNAALWSAYTDEELMGIHDRLLASIAPAEMATSLRWMVPAMSPAERAGMLGAMAQQMPPEALRGVLDIVQPHLDASAWAKLARALGLPPVPGLMTV